MEINLEENEAKKLQKEQDVIMKYLKNKKVVMDKILNKYGAEIEFHIIAKEIKK